MLRRIHIYWICIAFGLWIFLIICGSRLNTIINTETHESSRSYLKIEDVLLQPLPTNPYDGSHNIQQILRNTRSKINFDLRNYDVRHSGVHKLKDLLMEAGGKPVRNVVISAWRSGSTFFGELLNAMPGNFYHYEPLLKYQIKQIRGPPHADKAISELKRMLKCDFSGMEDYFEYGKNHLNYLNQFKHNSRLWDQCKYKNELCFDADFTSKMCMLFPFQSMKVVRFRLRVVNDILEDKELDVKVVLLIRDPRGVMQSRRYRNYCRPAPDCSQPELVCADMISDYAAARSLLKKYPGRLMVLRFEDIALNLNATTRRLLKFLRLGATQSIDEFLREHTNENVGGIDSTFRVTQNVPFKWRNVLEFDYVAEIQKSCREAMELWGYKLAHNASHLASKDFYPLEQYTVA